MGDLIKFFDDDFSIFGPASHLSFDTFFTKDMSPAKFVRWIEKDEDGKEIQKGYKAVIRTVGVDPDDVTVNLKDRTIIVDGKTEVDGYTYSQHVEYSVSRDVLSNLKEISYKSKDGLTYLYLEMSAPEIRSFEAKRLK